MTPQERQLVVELFDRLAGLEGGQRDPDAERAIAEGLSRAPHGTYALVQTVLVQDEALKQADARIRDLEASLSGAEPPHQGGFLDSMRSALTGRSSVPSVRPADAPMGTPPGFRSDVAPPPAAEPMTPGAGSGGSFLGTAAAGAAGAIGGALLLDSFRSMFGGHHGSAAAGVFDRGSSGERSPWGGSAADSDLAREAGIDDIGRQREDDGRQSAGLLNDEEPDEDSDFDGDDDDFDGDDGFDGDDSDTA